MENGEFEVKELRGTNHWPSYWKQASFLYKPPTTKCCRA